MSPDLFAIVLALDNLNEQGGASRQTVELARALSQFGHRVAFVTRWSLDAANDYTCELREIAVPLFSPKLAVPPRPRMGYRGRRAVSAVRSTIVKRPQPGRTAAWRGPITIARDAGLTAASDAARWFRASGSRRRIIHVLGRHSAPWIQEARRVPAARVFTEFGQLEYFGLSRQSAPVLDVHACTADSATAADDLRILQQATPVHVIPSMSAIPRSAFAARRRVRRAVVLARLVPTKRVELVIAAAASIPDLRLDVLGGGPLLDDLRALVVRLGCESRITVLGPVPACEVEAYLDSTDVLISASESEGTPTSVLEAMSRGVPVLARSTGGLRDVIEDRWNGWSFETDENLAPYLRRIVDMLDVSAVSTRARKTWLDRYSPDVVTGLYLAAYDEAHRRFLRSQSGGAKSSPRL